MVNNVLYNVKMYDIVFSGKKILVSRLLGSAMLLRIV